MSDFQTLLDNAPATPAQAFAVFDALAPVEVDFLIGEWEGSPFPTGHPMDGALEATGWRGKRFRGVDEVDPLIFDDGAGGTFIVDPVRFMSAPHPGKAFERRSEIETSAPAARLRTLVHRGIATTAMIYDGLAIIDTFRRVDDDTVLGVMDMRGLPLPYFFVLRRKI